MLLDKYQLLEDTFMFEGTADDSIIRERLLDSETMSILVDGEDYYVSFYNAAELHAAFGETLPDAHFGVPIMFYNMRIALEYLENMEELEK